MASLGPAAILALGLASLLVLVRGSFDGESA